MRIAVLLFIIFNFLFFYFRMPVLALGFVEWSKIVIAWGLILCFIAALALFNRFRQYISATVWGEFIKKLFPKIFNGTTRVVDISDYKRDTKGNRKYRTIAVIGLVMVIVGFGNMVVLPVLTSAPVFYSQSYRNLLGNVQESSFTADIEPINLSQIRIVDEETARKLADKKIGEVPALGSETQLGEMVLQKVKDKLYYVAPLEHRGIFQWLNNFGRGSKGFVMVSATNPQDVKLVQNNNGQDVYLRYQMQGFLFDYLPRYLYFHGIVNVGMSDFSFEVDDDLTPYWVVTLYKNKVGYAGSDAVGAVTVNAQTGEIKRYTIDDLPAWIDRVQPENLIYA